MEVQLKQILLSLLSKCKEHAKTCPGYNLLCLVLGLSDRAMTISQQAAENIGPFCFPAFQLRERTERNGMVGGSEVDSRGDVGASVKGNSWGWMIISI